MRAANSDGEHIKITRWSLLHLAEHGGWKWFNDITPSAVERLLPSMCKTAAYANCYIKKLKAFVHWALPDGRPDPLRKLKRVREKGAKRNRARRAAAFIECERFFEVWPRLPAYRHLCYALSLLNGLRRSNICQKLRISEKNTDGTWQEKKQIRKLTWGQIHLDAPIPFVALWPKMRDGWDYIPLHPYVVKLLQQRPRGLPADPVVAAVPDNKTLVKNLAKAEIKPLNAQGERLDYHALRHTCAMNLDRTGCSRATKKKLLRHAGEDVTDGYAHAELDEMLTALCRLPSPDSLTEVAVRSGTDDALLTTPPHRRDEDRLLDHQLDQTMVSLRVMAWQEMTKTPARPVSLVSKATLATIPPLTMIYAVCRQPTT